MSSTAKEVVQKTENEEQAYPATVETVRRENLDRWPSCGSPTSKGH
jgi:hypothetical protein